MVYNIKQTKDLLFFHLLGEFFKRIKCLFTIHKLCAFAFLLLLNHGLVLAQCNIISNGSFEDYSACPYILNYDVELAYGWENALPILPGCSATVDLYNVCDHLGPFAPSSPYPDGNGFAGLGLNSTPACSNNFKEYLGQFVDLCAGTEYTLSLWIAARNATGANFTNNFCIWAGNTPSFPVNAIMPSYCLAGFDNLACISSGGFNTTWQYYTVSFTPMVDYNAIAFGPSCGGGTNVNGYVFIDDVKLTYTMNDPVSWTYGPATPEVCLGDSIPFTLNLGGCYPPYDIKLYNQLDTSYLYGMQDGDQFYYTPTQSGLFYIKGITNKHGCYRPLNFMFAPVVVHASDPSWNPINPVCENQGALYLNTWIDGDFGGDWTGLSVSNNWFDPSGLGGSAINASYTVGAAGCDTTQSHSFQILPATHPLCNFRNDSCNLLKNGNFDQYSTCPTGSGQIIANGWYKGVQSLLCVNTSDYYNLSCPNWTVPFIFSPPLPIPSPNGLVGFYINNNSPACGGYYQEYLGQFIDLEPGIDYRFGISIALEDTTLPTGEHYDELENHVCLWGGNTASFPIASTLPDNCPDGYVLLACIDKTLINTSWQNFQADFTVPYPINSIIIGSSCSLGAVASKDAYVFVDDVEITINNGLQGIALQEIIPLGDSACIQLNYNQNISPFEVYIDDGENLYTGSNQSDWEVMKFLPNKDTDYWIKSFVDKYGCETVVDTIISIKVINDSMVEEEVVLSVPILPNSFTPNGDWLNDVFYPIYHNGITMKNYQFMVFDRWGEVVFKSTTPGEAWDGSVGGNKDYKDIKMDVYVWRLRYTDKSDKKQNQHGVVHLIR